MYAFLRNLQKLWQVLALLELWYLILATTAHYFLFWAALSMSEPEDNKITEAVNFWYFWSTTTLTIGYGDLSPTSKIGRMLTPVFQFTGVLLLMAWLAREGMRLANFTSRKRRGIVSTRAKDHILVIGDFSPTRTLQLLGNIIHDRKNDGSVPPIVCCFSNTGDRNPFERYSNGLDGVVPEYHQSGEAGFTQQTFSDINAKAASQIYVAFEKDNSALGVIGSLSRLGIKAEVAVLLREAESAELVPETSMELRVIPPIQPVLAVREMEDPGTGVAAAHLLDVTKGESLFSMEVGKDGEALPYGQVCSKFDGFFQGAAKLIGIVSPENGGWKPDCLPTPDSKFKPGSRLLYIGKRDASKEEEVEFKTSLLKV